MSMMRVAVGVSAASILAYLVWRRRTRGRVTLPTKCRDTEGNMVTVRLAEVSDREQVKASIADQTGTGSGVGNDDFLVQEVRDDRSAVSRASGTGRPNRCLTDPSCAGVCCRSLTEW